MTRWRAAATTALVMAASAVGYGLLPEASPALAAQVGTPSTTTTSPTRLTTTTSTLPPRPITTQAPTTSTTVPSVTTTSAPGTSTLPSTTTSTTEPSAECTIVAWRGSGSLEEGVPPGYQDPLLDAGLLNVFGSGFVPGEEIWLLIDGNQPAVVGDGPALVDGSGRFIANVWRTGGFMQFIEDNYTPPYTITAPGQECSASVEFAAQRAPVCTIVAWRGSGSLEEGVPSGYQDPLLDAGLLNVFGSGFVPGEEIWLLIDGNQPAVVGDGPALVDGSGRFIANVWRTGGFMQFIEDNYTPPYTITAPGILCSVTTSYSPAMVQPIPEPTPEEGSPLPAWLMVGLGVLGGLALAGAVYLLRLRSR